MFAIIILATAMTMVAGVFYVGVGQTISTNDEAVAAETARSAVNLLEKTMTLANTPANGTSFSSFDVEPNLFNAVRGGVLSPGDSRFAWVGMYQRTADSRVARVYVIVVRAQAGGQYTQDDLSDDFDPTSTYPPALMPKPIRVTLKDGGAASVDTLSIEDAPLAPAATPDGFVVISSGGADGSTAGRVYRLGNLIDANTRTYALAPGSEITPTDELTDADAMIVGRSYKDRTRPADGFEGTAQDVAIYRTFVTLK